MNKKIVIGFDGGGSQTRAVLADFEGKILGVGRAGSSNVNSLGLEESVKALASAASEAWKQAGQAPRPSAAAFLGLAGVEVTGLQSVLEQRLVTLGLATAGFCSVTTDTEIALAGGLAGRPGIVAIVGTGACCFGRDASGRTARCGGWGWLLDDVGSGAYLGKKALEAVLHASDGRGRPTTLGARIQAYVGVDRPEKLVSWLHARESYGASLASLAQLVTEAAQEEDLVAQRILSEGAKGVAELVRQVALRLEWPEEPELAIVGGLGRSGSPYQPLLEEAVKAAVRGIVVTAPEFSPAAGAVIRALRLAGVAANPETLERLRRDSEAAGLR